MCSCSAIVLQRLGWSSDSWEGSGDNGDSCGDWSTDPGAGTGMVTDRAAGFLSSAIFTEWQIGYCGRKMKAASPAS